MAVAVLDRRIVKAIRRDEFSRGRPILLPSAWNPCQKSKQPESRLSPSLFLGMSMEPGRLGQQTTSSINPLG